MVHKTLSQKHLTQKGWRNGLRCRPRVQAPVPQKRKKKSGDIFLISNLTHLSTLFTVGRRLKMRNVPKEIAVFEHFHG
jgi:hypothetical protein